MKNFGLRDTGFVGAVAAAATGGGGYSAFVQDWIDRVVLNGGADPSTGTKDAVETFYQGLVSDGIDSKMVSVILMVPDSVIAATTPLFAVSGNDPWTNTGPFTSSQLTINGLKGDGTKYLYSGVIPATHLATNSAGMTLYTYDGVNESSRDMGASDAGYSYMFVCHLSLPGTGMITDCWNTSGRVTAANSAWQGYTSINRDAAGMRVYQANSGTPHYLFGSIGPFGAAFAVFDIYLFCANSGGGPAFPCTKRFSFAAIHQQLSVTESANFYSRIQQFRTDIGGGYR